MKFALRSPLILIILFISSIFPEAQQEVSHREIKKDSGTILAVGDF
jgi:hypothetical protein